MLLAKIVASRGIQYFAGTDQTRLREFGAADDTVELAVAQQLLIIKTIYTSSQGRPDWLSTTARACSVSFRELPSFGPS